MVHAWRTSSWEGEAKDHGFWASVDFRVVYGLKSNGENDSNNGKGEIGTCLHTSMYVYLRGKWIHSQIRQILSLLPSFSISSMVVLQPTARDTGAQPVPMQVLLCPAWPGRCFSGSAIYSPPRTHARLPLSFFFNGNYPNRWRVVKWFWLLTCVCARVHG